MLETEAAPEIQQGQQRRGSLMTDNLVKHDQTSTYSMSGYQRQGSAQQRRKYSPYHPPNPGMSSQ